MSKSRAFTLSEVLITLGIIGVVASMTIPSLLKNYQDQQYKVAYKKAYADASNAFKLAIAKGEVFVAQSSTLDAQNEAINWEIFSSQFKITKKCVDNNNRQCWADNGEYSDAGKAPLVSAYAFVDTEGRAWSMRGSPSSPAYSWCFLVDTNGNKMPNKYGKDRWMFSWFPNNLQVGTPSGIFVIPDKIVVDDFFCHSGNCYYQSWILN